MTDLIPFDLGGVEVRFGTDSEGRPWVAAQDIAVRLGYRDAANALRNVDEAERGTQIVSTPGGDQRISVLFEAGIWELIFLSRRPEAKAIKARVKEILKQIRETGRYEVPADFATALELAAKQAREIAAQRAELSIVKPQAEAWSTLADTGADYSVREAAYILNRDPSISTGQMRLFALLYDWRLIGADKRPYATHAKHVTLRPQTRVHPTSGERIPAAPQVRVTVDGLAYLHKRLGGTEPLDVSPLGGAA